MRELQVGQFPTNSVPSGVGLTWTVPAISCFELMAMVGAFTGCFPGARILSLLTTFDGSVIQFAHTMPEGILDHSSEQFSLFSLIFNWLRGCWVI
jgi:hypothetical protein